MASFTQFGAPAGYPPTPLDQLPRGFQQAMARSQAGAQTPLDDTVMGSALSGLGYCADPQYRQQIYCACVNAPIANPECIFRPCANTGGGSYKTAAMQAVQDKAAEKCPQEVTCIQLVEMGGSDNVASGITQEMKCGGAGGSPAEGPLSTLSAFFRKYPYAVAAALIVFVSLVLLAIGSGGGGAGKGEKGGKTGGRRGGKKRGGAPRAPPL